MEECDCCYLYLMLMLLQAIAAGRCYTMLLLLFLAVDSACCSRHHPNSTVINKTTR